MYDFDKVASMATSYGAPKQAISQSLSLNQDMYTDYNGGVPPFVGAKWIDQGETVVNGRRVRNGYWDVASADGYQNIGMQSMQMPKISQQASTGLVGQAMDQAISTSSYNPGSYSQGGARYSGLSGSPSIRSVRTPTYSPTSSQRSASTNNYAPTYWSDGSLRTGGLIQPGQTMPRNPLPAVGGSTGRSYGSAPSQDILARINAIAGQRSGAAEAARIRAAQQHEQNLLAYRSQQERLLQQERYKLEDRNRRNKLMDAFGDPSKGERLYNRDPNKSYSLIELANQQRGG